MADENEDDGVLDALGDDSDQGVLSDQRLGGDLSDKEEKEPISVRDSIREAIKEESLPEEDKAEKRLKNLEKAREVRKLNRATKSDSEVDTNRDVSVKDTSGGIGVAKDVSTPTSDLQPPNGWTKEAKADWNKLPDYIKQSVAKREKEVSDGFKGYGDKVKKYDELEAVIAPRRETIQRFGVSEAQTVDRLFQWMDSLTGPNKLNSWLSLGQNFGINVNEFIKASQGHTPTNPQQQQQPNQATQIPDPIKQYVESAVGSVNQYVAQQKQEAASSFLSNWAKDKPHFTAVRTVMHALLNSGTIPLKDGNLDLDTAYDYACNSKPEIRTELMAASAEAAKVKEALDKEKAEAARIVRVNAARKAGASIKPTAPTGGDKSVKPRNNGKATSVRDSIRESISELANS